MEILKLKEEMVIKTFRLNLTYPGSVTNGAELFRMSARMKQALSIMRERCRDLSHPYDDYNLLNSTSKPELWDHHPSFSGSSPNEYILVFLQRLSDIHKTLSRLCIFMEPVIWARQDAQTTLSVSTYLQRTRDIHEQVIDTVRILGGQ